MLRLLKNWPKINRLTLLGIVGLLGLAVICLFHSPAVSASGFVITELTQYPRVGSSDVNQPANSQFWQDAGSPAGVKNHPWAVSNIDSSGVNGGALEHNQFYLKDRSGGNAFNKFDRDIQPPSEPNPCKLPASATDVCWWGERSQGGVAKASHYQVVVPIGTVKTAGGGVTVTLVNICKGVKDENGWEDHTFEDPTGTTPVGSIEVTTNSSYTNTIIRCTGGPNATINLKNSDYVKASNLGTDVWRAPIKIEDNSINPTEKVFSVAVSSFAFIGPAEDQFVNLRNPGADYYFEPAGNCYYLNPSLSDNGNKLVHKVQYSSNCPASTDVGARESTAEASGGYTTMNVPADSTDHQWDVYNASNKFDAANQGGYRADSSNAINSFNFYFMPDCNNNTSTLTWRNGLGGEQTAELNFRHIEHWTLTDTSPGGTPGLPYLYPEALDNTNNTVHFPLNSIPGFKGFVLGHVYQWQWSDVARAHGVSVQVPISEYTATPGFTPKVDCGGTSTPPAGNVDNTTCLFGSNGWAVDPDYATSSIRVRVFVMVSKDGNFDDWQVLPYFYKSVDTSYFNFSQTGVYDANGPNSANPFANGHEFNIPIDPNRSDPRDPWLLNGYRYKFLVYPIGVNSSGVPDGKDVGGGPNNAGFAGFPGNILMSGCANFHTHSSTGLNLNDSENPSSYTVKSTAGVDYPGLSPTYNSSVEPYSSQGESTTSWTKSGNVENADWTDSANNGFNPSVDSPGLSPCQINVYRTPNGGGPSLINSLACKTPPPVQLTRSDQPVNLTTDTGSTVAPYTAGDKYCASLNLQYASGLIGEDGNVIIGGPQYTDNGCDNVVNKPYVHFFGNDVSAGGGFGDSCTSTPGGINTYLDNRGYDNGGSDRPVGSGVQLGALSINPIYGFSSATLRSSAPTGSTGLLFSNNKTYGGTGPGGPQLSAGLGMYQHCVPDYWSKKPATTEAFSGSFAGGAHAYSASGSVSIGNGSPISISPGTNDILYVNGNVTINSPIVYGSDAGCAGAPCWSSIEDIPSLYIVVYGGNISIAPNVSQLDGAYISQPDKNGAGGNIYTCTTTDTSSLYNACHSQLVVNGAFVAQHLWLLRAYGSLRNSYPGERLQQNKVQACDSGNTTMGDCAAEIFNFSPELYLSQPNITPTSGPTTGKYDYITSLSPVL